MEKVERARVGISNKGSERLEQRKNKGKGEEQNKRANSLVPPSYTALLIDMEKVRFQIESGPRHWSGRRAVDH